MNIAIVGTGFIAETHAQEVTKLGHNLITVINPHLEKAKEFASRWNAKSYADDFSRALEDDVDVVHVCTPPMLHYEMVEKIIAAKKHVICEKPLCIDPDQAKDLYEKAKAQGIISAVNFNVRFHEAVGRAKDTIAADDFGRILMIHARYLQEFHALPADYSWRYVDEFAGPMRATTEIGSHIIDLTRFVTGLEIEEVSANFGKFNKTRYEKDGMMYEVSSADPISDTNVIEVDSDDAAIISLRLSNGAIGNILLSEVSHGRNNFLELEVTGSKKSVWWNSEEPYKLNSATKFSGVNTVTNAFGGGFPDTFSDFFKAVYRDIEKKIAPENPGYPTFSDAYINSAVCDAIYRSANNNSAWTKLFNPIWPAY